MKTLFASKILFTFFFLEKQLGKKGEFNCKIYGFTGWEKLITIHILSSISRSKDDQRMEFVC